MLSGEIALKNNHYYYYYYIVNVHFSFVQCIRCCVLPTASVFRFVYYIIYPFCDIRLIHGICNVCVRFFSSVHRDVE